MQYIFDYFKRKIRRKQNATELEHDMSAALKQYLPNISIQKDAQPVHPHEKVKMLKQVLSGVILGDIAGSKYEGVPLEKSETPDAVDLFSYKY